MSGDVRNGLLGAFRSRKFIVALLGIGCAMVVFLSGLGAVLICSVDKAQMVVGLANIVMVFLGAVIGSLVTGQSFVDWRHGSASQNVMLDSKKSDVRKLEVVARSVAAKHFDDESIS